MISPVQIWRNQKKMIPLIGKIGTIVSWTIIRVPPGDWGNQAPYPVVLAVLKNGRKICAMLADADNAQLKIGQKVVTVVRRVAQPSTEGVIPYGIKLKLL